MTSMKSLDEMQRIVLHEAQASEINSGSVSLVVMAVLNATKPRSARPYQAV